MQIKAIKKCRVCGSKNLRPILSLGELYISNFIDSPDDKTVGPKVPLELVLCDPTKGGCSLLQLKHTVPPELMYKQYWYLSGLNESMVSALQDITEKAERIVPLAEGDTVIDIGCNDGTLLRSYRAGGLKLIGFDPASNLLEYSSKGTTKIFCDFFNAKKFKEYLPGKKAKIITSIAMFYDLDEPNKFVADIKECLDENGVWIIQMSYLPLMLEQTAFDNICHEHLEYYSLISLQNLLNRHGFGVFDVELNDVNGGSYRVYIKHDKSTGLKPSPGAEERVKRLLEKEEQMGLQDNAVYDAFAQRTHELKERLRQFIIEENKKGKKTYVYGASTKGNTLLQFFGLDHHLIPAAVERNASKFGKRTVGTLIPIISEEQARREKPSYFLILPWHFLENFKEREQNFLKNDGKFIVPLPEFRIIGFNDL